MRTDSGIERSEGTPTPWPWTLSSIRTVVAEAAEYGFRLGIREPALAVAAGKGEVERSELPDAQYEALEETVESLAAAAEIRFDDAWEEEVAGWIEFAIEAAVVLGLRACGKVRADAALTDHERVQRADWFTSTVDDVLAKLIESLVASGHPVPHSQEFLDRHHGAGGDVRTFLAPREDAAREVRTAWIRDHDSGASISGASCGMTHGSSSAGAPAGRDQWPRGSRCGRPRRSSLVGCSCRRPRAGRMPKRSRVRRRGGPG